MKKKIFIFLAVILTSIILSAVYLYISNPTTLYIVSSLPNSSHGETMEQFRGIQIALNDIGYKAGKYKIEWLPLDNSDSNGWVKELEEKNAAKAIENKNVVAYYGPYNSGSVKISLPILNKAELLQVSVATWPGLTKAGFAIAEPMKFYPTGNKHFLRLSSDDSLQGKVAAEYLKRNNIKTVSIIHDDKVYGYGISMIFKRAAEGLGITVKYIGVVPDIVSIDEVTNRIIKDNPDALFIGSDVLTGIVDTYSKLRIGGYKNIILGSELISTKIEEVIGENDYKLYTVNPGIPVSSLNNPKALAFDKKYRDIYKEEPSQLALYAHQSIMLIIEAIKLSDGTRNGVLRAAKDKIGFDTAYGEIFFDENGDVVNNSSSILHMVRGSWVYEK